MESRHPGGVAYLRMAAGNDDIRGGQRIAPENHALFNQAMTDGTRPDGVSVLLDETAAAETDGENVRHTEVCPHTAYLDHHVRLARKSVSKDPHV